MKRSFLEWMTVILTVALLSTAGIKYHQQISSPIQIIESPIQKIPESSVVTEIPNYLTYKEIIHQLKEWEEQAKDLAEVGTYGKTTKGTDIFYIRINNEFDAKPKPKVLITACIHGNEPWSTGVVMAYAGTLLGQYGEDQNITDLVNSRDIYIIPVVSPDSYPDSRRVDGVDPNRNFPGPSKPDKKSVAPVKSLMDFVLQIKPNAIVSGHTWGRIFLQPYGDKNELCPDHEEYQRILKQMGEMCDYDMQRACEMYNEPIFGTEVDWYYRNKIFAIVMEFGTHQKIPTPKEIKSEFERTFQGVLWFIEEAPVVELKIKKY